jgi:hypothetical protein
MTIGQSVYPDIALHISNYDINMYHTIFIGLLNRPFVHFSDGLGWAMVLNVTFNFITVISLHISTLVLKLYVFSFGKKQTIILQQIQNSQNVTTSKFYLEYGENISYFAELIYVICVCLLIMMSNTYYVVFLFCLCTICCQLLWIVHL